MKLSSPISSIGLLFIVCFPLAGQTVDEDVKSWGYIGVKGGGQFSEVFFNDTFRPVNMRTSFIYGKHFGLVGKLFMAEHAGIQSEINFIEKGYKQLLDSGLYTSRMNYIEVPLLMNAYLGKRKLQFFVNLGPYIEFFVNKKDDLVGVASEGDEFYPFDQNNDRVFGYGLKASGGLNRLFPFGLLQLEGGMGISISDMLYSNRLISTIPDGSKHVVGFVSLSYMIPLGKMPDN